MNETAVFLTSLSDCFRSFAYGIEAIAGKFGSRKDESIIDSPRSCNNGKNETDAIKPPVFSGSSSDNEVLNIIRKSEFGANMDTLTEQTGIPPKDLGKILGRLKKKGKVREERFTYKLKRKGEIIVKNRTVFTSI